MEERIRVVVAGPDREDGDRTAEVLARALRDAFEGERNCYVVGWRGESKEAATGYFRISFDLEWHVYR